MKNRRYLKELFKKSLILTLAASVVSWLVCLCLQSWIPILGVDSDSYLQGYYNWRNESDRVHYSDSGRTLVLVNTRKISGTSARSDIAEVIEKVCDAGAKVVGVDILFQENNDPNSQRLRDVIFKYSDRLVLTCVHHDSEIVRSFFDFDNDSLQVGLANLPPMSHYRPEYDTLPELFSYKIARLAFPDRKWDFEKFVVNYETAEIMTIPSDWILSYSIEELKSYLEGKIVLLGDLNNDKDIHETSFKIGGATWSDGLILHALPILSLSYPDYAMSRLYWAWDLLLCFVLTFFFSILFAFVTLLSHFLGGEDKLFLYQVFLIAKPFLIALSGAGLLWGCYFLFTKSYHIVPNIVQYLIAFVIISNKISGYVSYLLTRSKDE